jgi:hypothetical protein
MEEVDREISEMKLSLNARARIVAESYLTAVRSSASVPNLSADNPALCNLYLPSSQFNS